MTHNRILSFFFVRQPKLSQLIRVPSPKNITISIALGMANVPKAIAAYCSDNLRWLCCGNEFRNRILFFIFWLRKNHCVDKSVT